MPTSNRFFFLRGSGGLQDLGCGVNGQLPWNSKSGGLEDDFSFLFMGDLFVGSSRSFSRM